MTDQRLALTWHLLEFLVVMSVVGVVWSAMHQNPRRRRMVETSRQVAG